MGRFIPPDHSKGDESTVGGYRAVHDRPATLEGSDGASYTVEVATDETGDAGHPFGAYLLFVCWRPGGAPAVSGHLESGFLCRRDNADAACERVGTLTLEFAQLMLDELIRLRDEGERGRSWWEAMRDDDDAT